MTSSEINALINGAQCADRCIPPGMMISVLIGQADEWQQGTPPVTLQGILSDEGDYILDDSGNRILPDVAT